jgi:hypothetical protein
MLFVNTFNFPMFEDFEPKKSEKHKSLRNIYYFMTKKLSKPPKLVKHYETSSIIILFCIIHDSTKCILIAMMYHFVLNHAKCLLNDKLQM